VNAIFFGVRGTCAVTGDAFRRFGGDTTAILITGQDGERICLDAGSGMLNVSQELRDNPTPSRLLLLMTHYHLDHICGLGSLAQLYDSRWSIRIAAPPCEGVSVQEAIARILDKPYWPVRLADMAAQTELIELPVSPPAVSATHGHGGMQIRWCPVHHNDGCTAYRIDEPATGDSLVFATDLEWRQASGEGRAAFLRLCAEPAPARLLIFDGQYTHRDYEAHAGWGHSTCEEAVNVARQARIERLLVTHHAPDRTDDMLDRIESELIVLMAAARLARQGMLVDF
jgi:ribonuclease BN (tRNA processing enzyme)